MVWLMLKPSPVPFPISLVVKNASIDAGAMLLGDAAASVAYRDAGRAILLPGAIRYFSLCLNGMPGVDEQVHNDLAQLLPVASIPDFSVL
jgi:hypothetical protein